MRRFSVLLFASILACQPSPLDSNEDSSTSTDSDSSNDTENNPDDTGIEKDTVSNPDETGIEEDTQASPEDTDEGEIPDPTATGGIAWYLDNELVATADDSEAWVFSGTNVSQVMVPYFGRNIQLSWEDANDIELGNYDCWDIDFSNPNRELTLGLITSDNGWANLDNVPDSWKGLTFSYCETPDVDDVLDFSMTLEETSPRMTGQIEIEIVGAGPRAGQTLRIEAWFDREPDAL